MINIKENMFLQVINQYLQQRNSHGVRCLKPFHTFPLRSVQTEIKSDQQNDTQLFGRVLAL